MVMPYLMASNPRYFILGPLVFSQATQDYLERLGGQGPALFGPGTSPLVTRRFDKPSFPGEEIVVVASPMFPHRITNGYDDANRAVLSEVNGVKVRNLRHVMEIIRDSQDSQIVLKFAGSGVLTHETMVFSRNDLLTATNKILEENGIRYPYSTDLRGIWEAYSTVATKSAQVTCCGIR
jgi:hypothetical protein